MKTTSLLTLTIAAGSLMAFAARGGIVGSPHDFSHYSWNTDPADPATVCSTCHTPHHADNSVAPLWGHQITSQNFILYTGVGVPGSAMQAVPSQSQLNQSLACLSCHDGTVAINTYGGNPQWGGPAWKNQYNAAGQFLTNSALITVNNNDLSHSHPIGFTYDSTLVSKDKFLRQPTANVLIPVSGQWNPPSDPTVNGFLLNGNNTVECTSCHDVHNEAGTPYDPTANRNLVKIVGVDGNGDGSLLCRSCHNK
jgi:hypothetical protein